jgi:hypothetical protein
MDERIGAAGAPEPTDGTELRPSRGAGGEIVCGHANPLLLRVIEYTRYGTWMGCQECGTSWLIREPG